MRRPRRRAKLIGLLLSIALLVVLLNRLLAPAAAAPPTWNGITPSVTTRAEVRTLLGEPTERWQCNKVFNATGASEIRLQLECLLSLGIVNYGYHSEHLPDPGYALAEIYFRRGGTVDVLELSYKTLPTVHDLVEQYGRPARILWSRERFTYRTLLYCEQGRIFLAEHMLETTVVYKMWLFTPMTEEKCIQKFYYALSGDDPFADVDFPYFPLDPWGIAPPHPESSQPTQTP